MTERYPEPTPQIEVYTVIEVTFRRGKGTPEAGDVVRMVKAYYRDDGEFLFEIDPFPDKEGSVPAEGDAQWEHPRLGVAALREGFEPKEET